MENLYFTSDTHFGQRNIITKLSNWHDLSATRDFESVAQMDRTLIDNINETVSENDTLYHLGDFAMRTQMSDLAYYRKQIRCKNVILILGNHDHTLRRKKEFTNRQFQEVYDYGKKISLKYPLPGTDPLRDKWQGLQEIVLSHYAMRVWDKSHYGSWMLYGHSHSSLDVVVGDSRDIINRFYLSKKTMDVGIDNAFRLLGEYRPFSFWELKSIMSDKEALYIDHHDKRP